MCCSVHPLAGVAWAVVTAPRFFSLSLRLSNLIGNCEAVRVTYPAFPIEANFCLNRFRPWIIPKNKRGGLEKMARRSVRCPRCGSGEITSNTKGFGLGKAAAGGCLIGPLGLLGGLFGSKKIRITCLRCGRQFAPGEGQSFPHLKHLMLTVLTLGAWLPIWVFLAMRFHWLRND